MKKYFLILSKYLGLFYLTEALFRRRLNILCYHGFSYDDEHEFRPSLFMRSETLELRLAWLAKHGYRTVSLDEGLRLLRQRKLPPKTIVITIDDGFRSTLELAAPIFKKYGFSATVYVTSYYAAKQTPIFRLAIQYYAWKAGASSVKPALFSRLPEKQFDSLMDGVEYAEMNLSESERVDIAREVARELGENYDQLAAAGLMSLMSSEEIREINRWGIDVQLHTHRHCLPLDRAGILKEITDNRNFLEPLLNRKLTHFCYPSGRWHSSQMEPLAELGIDTATTCEPGMNTNKSHSLALKRFLDRDDFDQIEFEAELHGFKELMRLVRDFITRRKNPVGSVAKAVT